MVSAIISCGIFKRTWKLERLRNPLQLLCCDAANWYRFIVCLMNYSLIFSSKLMINYVCLPCHEWDLTRSFVRRTSSSSPLLLILFIAPRIALSPCECHASVAVSITVINIHLIKLNWVKEKKTRPGSQQMMIIVDDDDVSRRFQFPRKFMVHGTIKKVFNSYHPTCTRLPHHNQLPGAHGDGKLTHLSLNLGWSPPVYF